MVQGRLGGAVVGASGDRDHGETGARAGYLSVWTVFVFECLCVCRLSPDQRGLRLLLHKERQELLRHCEVGEVVGLLSDVCISQLVPDKAAATADRISSISYRHFFHQQWNIQRLRLAEVCSALHP